MCSVVCDTIMLCVVVCCCVLCIVVLCLLCCLYLYNNSSLAQRKRVGLITQRSVDRNHQLLYEKGAQRSGSASALQAEGPGFNPRRVQFCLLFVVLLYNMLRCLQLCLVVNNEINNQNDCVAQWIAHLTSNQGVVGSSPTAVDNFMLKQLYYFIKTKMYLKCNVEKMGIDPITSCMLSRRSTI